MESDTPITHSITVASDVSEIRDIWQRLLAEMEANDFTKEDAFSVHLAMEEAFVNAVKHGNRMDAEKKVTIEYCVTADRIEISIEDEGQGFDVENVPDPRSGKNLYRAEGRGVLLIRSYMDTVEFSKGGRRVHMVRYKEKPRFT